MKIELQNIKKSYRGKCVLDIEQCTLPSSSIIAIVGPNGAGKSTLLHIVANLLEPDQGQILYDQKTTVPLENMTCVFQKPYLLSTTVKNNMTYPLKIRKKSKEEIQQKVNQLAKDLQLLELLNKKSNELSLGEIQKVALARAISFEPDCLLLDEPSASIDSYTTSIIEKNLLHLNQNKKMTILLVTHNLAQAKRIADVVILLNKGKIVEMCDKETFFTHPASSQTQAFIEGELI